MTLLAADIGNAHRAGAGRRRSRDRTAHRRVATDEQRTADEWGVLLRGLLGPRLGEIDGVAVGASVPAALHEWRTMRAANFPRAPSALVDLGYGQTFRS